MTITERPLLGRVKLERTTGAPISIGPVTNLTIRRGGSRNGLVVKQDVGLMSFIVKDAEDPMNGGTFAPGQTIRALGGPTAETVIFTGRVVDIASIYRFDKATGATVAMTKVTVADAVGIHTATTRYGRETTPGYETFEDRIVGLATSAQAAIETPAVGGPRTVYAL